MPSYFRVDYPFSGEYRGRMRACLLEAYALATRAGIEGQRIAIKAPLLHLSKGDIIRQGLSLGLDYGRTHSCYDPLPSGAPCGRCDSCRLCARGFAQAGVADPVLRGVEQ